MRKEDVNSKWLGVLVVRYKLMEETGWDEEKENNTAYQRVIKDAHPVVPCFPCCGLFTPHIKSTWEYMFVKCQGCLFE